MNGFDPQGPRVLPSLGCLSVAAAFLLMCLLPVFLVDAMSTSLARLHLPPPVALMAVLWIFLGSLINIPLYRIERSEDQIVDLGGVFGFWGSFGHGPLRMTPWMRRIRQETVVAINVGGCLIPAAIAVWEITQLVNVGGWPVSAMLIAAAVNSAVCYAAARPVAGVGIAMPGFVSPLTSVGITWLLLGIGANEFAELRAPVAFVAGVTGPLIGADLFHLKDITRVSVGMLSIGGAGTFDGIVLSGVLAALLA